MSRWFAVSVLRLPRKLRASVHPYPQPEGAAFRLFLTQIVSGS